MKKTLLTLALVLGMLLSMIGCGSATYQDYDLNAYVQLKNGEAAYKGLKILKSDVLKHLEEARQGIIDGLISQKKIEVHELVEKDVAQTGDVVKLTYKGTVKGETEPNADCTITEAIDVTIGTDVEGLPAGFDEALVGAMKGGSLEKDLVYPADHAKLANKEVHFVIAIESVFRPGYHMVHEGDTVTVTYIGDVMDGETVVTAGAVKGTGESVKLGDNDMPEGFDAALIGKRVGETVKVTVTYGADAAEAVANKTVALSVKIDDITATTFKEVTKDTLPVCKDGDTLDITYEGILVGETTPFEGGSAKNYKLELGSGTFIDGYEDGLIGCPVGITVKLHLTFPADYGTASLKNKEVDFTVTVNSISRTDEDALTLTLLNEYLKSSYQTMEEWEKDESEAYVLSSVQEKMLDNVTVLTYPKKEVTNYANNLVDTYEMYAASYGYTLAGYVKMMGYSTVEAFYDYAIAYAQKNAKAEMSLLLIAQKENITLSDAEVNAYLEEHYAENGFESAKKFKREIGEDVIRMVALCEKTAEQLKAWAVVEDDTAAKAE